MLREETALNISAWKAEHEDVYAEFMKKMDDIGVGDMSVLMKEMTLSDACTTT